MTINLYTYLFCFLAGLLGIASHILFIKLPALKASSKVANIPFSMKSYFEDDWVALAGSLLTVIICMFVLPELVKWQPDVINFLRWLFIVMGFAGSTILQATLGKTVDKINQVIDAKTNIADGTGS